MMADKIDSNYGDWVLIFSPQVLKIVQDELREHGWI
jgi:hypothetical protein